jgi:uncharacterized protein YdiU (UPF0061 family)
LEFLRELIHRTARLIAQWQSVGFAHGVMNTDNMSIIGLTIDYGPFGFLDEYEAGFICNHSDYGGRYAFNQQPGIALWNLSCFAQTLIPLVEREAAIVALDEYHSVFAQKYGELMRQKLGFQTQQSGDEILILDLLQILETNKVDYTRFFRRLADFKTEADAKNDALQAMFIDESNFIDWSNRYRARLAKEDYSDELRREQIRRINPKFILRNHIAQSAIEKAQARDYSEVNTLLKVLQNPFDEQPEMEHFAEPPPVGSKRIAVSCSS